VRWSPAGAEDSEPNKKASMTEGVIPFGKNSATPLGLDTGVEGQGERAQVCAIRK
jgi:hypothetical protein